MVNATVHGFGYHKLNNYVGPRSWWLHHCVMMWNHQRLHDHPGVVVGSWEGLLIQVCPKEGNSPNQSYDHGDGIETINSTRGWGLDS